MSRQVEVGTRDVKIALAITILTAAWCIAGIFGWPTTGAEVIDIACLPINAAIATWAVSIIRRERVRK